MRHTYTYAVLEIAKESFDDIRLRLQEVEMYDKYHSKDDDGKDIIIFGTVALKAELI